MLGFTDVVEQTHAENTVDSVIRQGDVERRRLQGLYPFHHFSRLRLCSDLDHGIGVVGTDDHAVGFFRQHRPETPRAAGQIEDQARLANQRQRLARHLHVAPVGQAAANAILMLLQVTLGVLIVVLVGKIQFDRAIHHLQSLLSF
ncbi:hypothetical protein D3C84_769730 [compost metagenome]